MRECKNEDSTDSLLKSRNEPLVEASPANGLDLYNLMNDSDLYNFHSGSSNSDTKSNLDSAEDQMPKKHGIAKLESLKTAIFKPPCFMVHPDNKFKKYWNVWNALLVVLFVLIDRFMYCWSCPSNCLLLKKDMCTGILLRIFSIFVLWSIFY